ncbi:MAG: peptidoglycan-associated lipoprotein Pal [Deltaproteobacteria bacterium]|nr:peptidoglycan-associated lipoprotein Pal [Deltaproteobacteria bacterium]
MKRKSIMILMVVFVLGLAFGSITGCAKKSTIREAAVSEEKEAAVQEQAAPEAQPKAVVPAEEKAAPPVVAKEETAREQAAEETAPPRHFFEKIYFDFDKYDLKSESRVVLEEVANFLNNNSKYILRIEGHCDERGTAEYNLALGQRRADEAKNYLVKLGIDEERISTLSYGEELPADPGHNEEAWAKNRRDNFVPILTK